MKEFMNFIKRVYQISTFKFIINVIGIYLIMLVIFLYMLNSNVSNAPEFVYNQF